MASSPDRAPTEQLEELLTCCICAETFEEPLTLPCLHSFCKTCLARYIEAQRELAQLDRTMQHQYTCPQCRAQFELKDGQNVERLPSNFFINNMLEIMKMQQEGQKCPCQSCKAKEPATCRCTECERYLCKNCLTAHNNWPDFKEHVVLTLEELTKPENQAREKGRPQCKKLGHGNKPLEFYCNTCKELTCIACVVLNHPKPDHFCQPVDIVAEQQKNALKETSTTLQEKSSEGMDALRKTENAIQNVQASTRMAKDIVLRQEKQILQEFFLKLKHNTSVLLGQVESKHDDVYQKLVKQHSDMKAYVNRVNGSLEFARNIIENGSKEEILSLGRDIEMNAKEIVKECPESLRPVHFGCLKYEQANSPKIIVENQVDLADLGRIVDDPIQSLLDNSTILDGNFEHAKQLVDWMEDKNFGWQLCYRASRDGWKGEDFHRKCDDVGPTLTLVKCETNIFGGFTDQSWKEAQTSAQTQFKHSDVSFLFSLRNKDNLRPFKCPIEVHGKEKAIWCYPGFGATFGGFRDLHISGNANTTQNSFSNLGSTYQPPPGYHYGSPQTKALLAGSYKFQPTSIEVFRG